MLLGASLLFAGCTHDFDEPALSVPTPESKIAINIDGSIAQVYTTRVDDGGFCDGDQIGIFGVNYTDNNSSAGELINSGNQVDNARYTFDAENWVWKSSGSIYYKDANTNIDLYGYYPYGHPKSVNAYEFAVAQDQSGETAVNGYSESDFLWGKAENITPSDRKVKMRFNHMMASVSVTLVEGDGFAEGEFAALSKSVMVMNTTRNSTVDLSTGVVTPVGEADESGIVMRRDGDGFRAIVVPQSVEAGAPLFVITVDGINYRFKKSEEFNYPAGKLSKFTIRIKKKAMSGSYEFELVNSEIVEWVADNFTHGGEARQYYVVHLDEAGTLEAKIKADDKNPAKIKNLKVSGQICKADFEFMKNKMEILQAVNLKEAELAASWCWCIRFEGDTDYHNEYFTGVMPESHDECVAILNARYPDKKVTSYSSRYQDSYDFDIPNNAFNGKSTLVYFVFPEKVTRIGHGAFSGTKLSGALVIPDDVVEIGDSAFNNTLITSLSLPHGLKTLGGSVFSECFYISNDIYLPDTLESIGSRCFHNCQMMTGRLVIPSKVTIIPESCFWCCISISELVLHDGITEIGRTAFCMNVNSQSSKLAGTKLVLPKTIKKIGKTAFAKCYFQGELFIPKTLQEIEGGDTGWGGAFAENSFSSIVFEEESELVSISHQAFAGNSRLSEPVVLPDNVMTIGMEAFRGCSNLPSIVLPERMTVIGDYAFNGCSYLTSLTCKATTPPVVGGGTFNGVPKDNFTLQVPERSVPIYQTANGWSDFKRVSANYDFSISRKHLRALNDEFSATYLLRVPSGEPWSIESCPEWVTVTPSSGVGRCEVTVTITEMEPSEVGTFTREEWNNGYRTETHSGRAGDIVFLLDNKDARVTMAAEQYDYEYGDGDVIVNQRASVGGGVNLVFMGDCFDARDIAMGTYLDGINEAIGYYFAIEPYKHYRDYFNVYTVVGVSPDSGMGTVNTIKDAKFGSQYSLEGIAPNTATTFEYAMKAEGVTENNLSQTLVVLVENTNDYGGICYMWGDGSAIAVCPMSRDAYPFDFRGIVQHEAGGHGFAKLADEYIYHNAFIQTCDCNCCDHLDEFNAAKGMGWYRNLSTNGDHKSVEWAHLFANPDYTNIVDMYEGGFFHARGIYRSEANSCMNNNVPYYSAISRQEMVERIKQYAGEKFDIDDFYARDVRDASNNTRATIFEPSVVISDAGVGKQMPPKYMGDKPQLNKSNK